MSPAEQLRKHRQRLWSAKEGCENVLTGALGFLEVDISHSWRVPKHLEVTFGTFVEASSADWSQKKGAGMFLPVIPVSLAQNLSSDLQLAKTAMSPAEHSWKHRQRTGPRKKGAGMFLPVHLVLSKAIKVIAGVFSNTLMSPAEYSRKHRQRTGTLNKWAGGGEIPVHLVRRSLISLTDGVCSKTLMSPAEHSRKHHQRTGLRKYGCGNVLDKVECGNVLTAALGEAQAYLFN